MIRTLAIVFYLLSLSIYGQVKVVHFAGSEGDKIVAIGSDSSARISCLVDCRSNDLIIDKKDSAFDAIQQYSWKYKIFRFTQYGQLINYFEALTIGKQFKANCYKGSQVNTIDVLPGGDILVAGVLSDSVVTVMDSTLSLGACGSKVFICRVDTLGKLKWLKTSSKTEILYVFDATLDSLGIKVFGSYDDSNYKPLVFSGDTVTKGDSVASNSDEEWIVVLDTLGNYRYSSLPFSQKVKTTVSVGANGMIASDHDSDSTICVHTNSLGEDYYSFSIKDSSEITSNLNTYTPLLEYRNNKFHMATTTGSNSVEVFYTDGINRTNIVKFSDNDLYLPPFAGSLPASATNKNDEKVICTSYIGMIIYGFDATNQPAKKYFLGSSAGVFEDVAYVDKFIVAAITGLGSNITIDTGTYSTTNNDAFLVLMDTAYFNMHNVGINDITTNGYQRKVFPNPSQNQLTITANGLSGPYQLQILNLLGDAVLTKNGTFNGSVHIQHSLPAGVYLVHLRVGEERFARKLIVETD